MGPSRSLSNLRMLYITVHTCDDLLWRKRVTTTFTDVSKILLYLPTSKFIKASNLFIHGLFNDAFNCWMPHLASLWLPDKISYFERSCTIELSLHCHLGTLILLYIKPSGDNLLLLLLGVVTLIIELFWTKYINKCRTSSLFNLNTSPKTTLVGIQTSCRAIGSSFKTLSTRIQIFLKPHIFLSESAFHPHETSESAHRNRIFLKPLSRVDFLIRRVRGFV